MLMTLGLLFRLVFYVFAALVGMPLSTFKLDKGKARMTRVEATTCVVSMGGTYGIAFS